MLEVWAAFVLCGCLFL